MASPTKSPRVHLSCPACQKPLRAPPEALGKRCRCSQCGNRFVLSDPASALDGALEPSNSPGSSVVLGPPSGRYQPQEAVPAEVPVEDPHREEEGPPVYRYDPGQDRGERSRKSGSSWPPLWTFRLVWVGLWGGIPALFVALSFLLASSNVNAPGTIGGLCCLSMVWVPIAGWPSRWAAYQLTRVLVTRLRCPDCALTISVWGPYDCFCGYKSKRSRNVLDKCSFCGGWSSHVPCPACESTIIVWGKKGR